MVIGDMMRRGWRSASYTSASTDPHFWFTISSSIFPGPFVHQLVLELHGDFTLRWHCVIVIVSSGVLHTSSPPLLCIDEVRLASEFQLHTGTILKKFDREQMEDAIVADKPDSSSIFPVVCVLRRGVDAVVAEVRHELFWFGWVFVRSSWQHIGIYFSTYFLLLLCLNCENAKLFIMVLCSSSSIFPGPFVHRLVVGLHTDFALHLDWFDCRDSDLVTKVRPDLSFDCGVGLQDYPEQLCLLLPTLYPLCSVPGFARIN